MAKRNAKGSLLLLVALAAVIVLLAAQVKPAVAADYSDAIELAVKKVVESNIGDAPGLVRLVFHDCFVRGCDASVLLRKTATTEYPQTEQGSPFNGGLRGLQVIQQIRDAIFTKTRVNVSCADAVVFAAREATSVLSKGLIKYSINGPGRQDGIISSADEPGRFLPAPTDNFAKLMAIFEAKGFNLTDLVALTGAHGIGVTHRDSFKDRLTPDVVNRTEINEHYQGVIDNEQKANPSGAFKNNIRDMGKTAVRDSKYSKNLVNMTAVGVLDNSFYNANLQNMVRFESDWVLRTNTTAELLMETYQTLEMSWRRDFKAAMTKLSNNIKADGPFEAGIRMDCTRTNP